MANTQNPLAGFYRSPKLYTRLPTQGKFYDEGVIEWPETGELAVFPMTAKDEMIMKNPDALLNGEAVAQVISSCVPAVKKPRQLISNDVDALLVAIQGATNGDEIEVNGNCSNCSEAVSGIASIEAALDTMTMLKSAYSFDTAGGLKVEIRPYTYESTVKAGIANFQSTRSLQGLAEIKDEMEQLKAFNQNFMQIAALNFELIVDSVSAVRGVDAEGDEFIVTDRGQIQQFLENCESTVGKQIEGCIKEVNDLGINKTMQLECEACGTTFEQEIGFDPVNFFTAS